MPDLFKTLSRLLKDPYRGIEGVLKFRNENRNSDLNSIDTFLKRKGFPKKLRAFGFQLGWSTGHPQSQRKDGKSRLSDAMRYLTSFGDSSYQRILAKGFQEGQKEGLDFFWDTDAKAFPQGAIRVASRYMEIRRRNKVTARYLKADFPKDRWIDISWESLTRMTKVSVWDMYDLTYATLGKHVPNQATFGKKYRFLYLIDLDQDPKPDVFIAYKKTKAGNKIALAGTDGTRKAKKAMILKMKELVRKSGWYVEASHKVADILESAGAKPLDEETVRKTLPGKEIEWLGDGKYNRQLGSSSISAAKSLYGNPKVARTQTPQQVAARYLIGKNS